MFEKISKWLDAHPRLHGLVVTVESSLAGAASSVLSDYVAGTYTLSRDGLKKMGVFILSAVVIGLRNWIKQPPAKTKTLVAAPPETPAELPTAGGTA